MESLQVSEPAIVCDAKDSQAVLPGAMMIIKLARTMELTPVMHTASRFKRQSIGNLTGSSCAIVFLSGAPTTLSTCNDKSFNFAGNSLGFHESSHFELMSYK